MSTKKSVYSLDYIEACAVAIVDLRETFARPFTRAEREPYRRILAAFDTEGLFDDVPPDRLDYYYKLISDLREAIDPENKVSARRPIMTPRDVHDRMSLFNELYDGLRIISSELAAGAGKVIDHEQMAKVEAFTRVTRSKPRRGRQPGGKKKQQQATMQRSQEFIQLMLFSFN
jgi:hypothetical protein